MSSLSLTFFATTAPRVLAPSSSSNPKLSPSSYSFSAITARRHSTAVSFRSGARRTSATCPCASFSSFNVRAMAKMVQDRESAVSSSSASDEQNKKMLNIEVNHSRTFLDVRSEQDLLSGIGREVEAGRLPSNLANGMEELYHNYKNAVFQSGNSRADEIVLSNMAVAFDRVLLDIEGWITNNLDRTKWCGGRDRPDPVTGEWYPVEKEIGEKRAIPSQAGLSVAPEISFADIITASKNPEEAKEVYTQAFYNSVTEQYNVLKSAIHGKQGLKASIPSVSLSQPWGD
ncbi:hypothetical protein CUMW_179790 [Citrus unshiu]|uniref:glycerol-3-phosphate 1-O-acyltransferase n=2 Tax=Citrus unshiu TaxID=55188 RepID=A0A2H5PYR1_CITUN|nr:hypothetical protein CUMW_179790 [Citrus unshiu]